MKIKFIEYGFFGKSFKVDDEEFKLISKLENGELMTEADSMLTIKDRLLKQVSIDLSRYEYDIEVHLASVKGLLRGKVIAIVVQKGTKIDVINGED